MINCLGVSGTWRHLFLVAPSRAEITWKNLLRLVSTPWFRCQKNLRKALVSSVQGQRSFSLSSIAVVQVHSEVD